MDNNKLAPHFEAQGTGRKFWYLKQVSAKTSNEDTYYLCSKKKLKTVKKDLAAHEFSCMSGIFPLFDWKQQ